MGQMYFLDANILIAAKNDTYPFDVFPSFWNCMEEAIKSRKTLVLDVVKKEILKGKDELETWLRKLNPQVIYSNEQIIIDAYSKVLEYAYSLDSIKSSAKDDWFRTKDIADPWLIAVAMAYNGKIVTNETDIRPNAKKRLIIPNIASYFSVKCIKAPQMMKELNMVI